MADKLKSNKKPVSADWFVQGVLTKIGDALDRLAGRGWKPSSSLATSELIERLKTLVDTEVREDGSGRRYVPHNVSLKMQWDKFSTDSDGALRKLEIELLTALVDHINDRRYYTYSPISLKVKPDYFINGVKLFASFDIANADEGEASLNVTVPDLKADLLDGRAAPASNSAGLRILARFESGGKQIETILDMKAGDRVSIGRTRENDLALNDPSVSKMHASLLLIDQGEMVVADTGSTNGTFIDDERIAYGIGNVLSEFQKLRFGTVEVELEVVERLEPVAPPPDTAAGTEGASTYKIDEFEFASGPQKSVRDHSDPLPAAAVPIAETISLKPQPQETPAAPRQKEPDEAETELSSKS